MAANLAAPTGRPARIALVAPFGLQPKGTTARRALPLARALARRGHEVSLFLVPWDAPQFAGRTWRDQGVTVVNLPLQGGPAAGVRRLLANVVGMQARVVHCFKPKGYGGLVLGSLLWARRLGLWHGRLVLDSDDWESGWNDLLGDPAWLREFFARQERWCLVHADSLTLASHWLAGYAAALRHGARALFYVPNGVVRRAPLPRGAPLPRQTPVLLVGTRFSEVTPERIVRIWRRVSDRVPQARLVVAGDSLPPRGRTSPARAAGAARLAGLLAAAGLQASVNVTGWVPPPAWPGVVAAADLAWLPAADTLANRARCPARLADFLAAGLPVAADAVGEAETYIEPGVNGMLLDPGNDGQTVDVLCGLLLDRTRVAALGRRAAALMQRHFTWDDLVVQVEAAYAEES